MFDLTGKRALVTGSTQGIGFEAAKLLAKQGAVVYINGASSDEKCKAASEKIPNSIPVRANLADKDEINALYEKTGGVDILVLNASVQYKRKWDGYTDDEFDMQLDCNLKSTYYMIKKYAPYMQKQKWGRIVTIGSVNQYNNHPELSVYGVASIPAGYVGTPEDVSAAVLLLCSDEGRYITGSEIIVDGGMHL